MVVNKPVIWSGIFNCLLKLIIGTFQHTLFPLLWPYGSLTCTLSTYERSHSNYLKHLYNVFYIQKSARFLAGYNLCLFNTIIARALGAKQNLSPTKSQSDLALTALTEGAGAEAPFPSSAAVCQTPATASQQISLPTRSLSLDSEHYSWVHLVDSIR